MAESAASFRVFLFMLTGAILLRNAYAANAYGTKILKAYYGGGYFNNAFRCSGYATPASTIDVTGQLFTWWIDNWLNLPITLSPGSIDWGVPRPLPLGSNHLTIFYADNDMADVIHDNDYFQLLPLNGSSTDDPVTCNPANPRSYFQAYWGIPHSLASANGLVGARLIDVSAVMMKRAINELTWYVTQFDFGYEGIPDPAPGIRKYLVFRWTTCVNSIEGGYAGYLREQPLAFSGNPLVVFPPGLCP